MPILIHGGRGLPPIAAHLHALVERCAGVQLIIAHAGIADMGNLTARFAGLPGVFFDTSVWSAVDLLDFYRQMPPEQVVYASDYPYARQPNSLLMALRTARLAGFDERQIANLWRQRGRASQTASRRSSDETEGRRELTSRRIMARIHQYLDGDPLMSTSQADTMATLVSRSTPQTRRRTVPEETEQIRELLETAKEFGRGALWTTRTRSASAAAHRVAADPWRTLAVTAHTS